MSLAKYHVRRAVIDDLPGLIPLWQGMNFSPEELEKRLTDFQVAVDGQGNLLGTVAFEIAGQQGRIRHEAFHDFGLADQLRPLFWERIQMLAQSNGVFRLWTQEDAPFWRQTGLQSPPRDVLQKLPAKWSNAQGGWFTLPLKDEAAIQALAGSGEIELLMEAERAATQKLLDRGRMLKQMATVVAILLAMLVGLMVLYAFKHDPSLLEQFQQR